MSTSLAAAKKRRAPIQQSTPPPAPSVPTRQGLPQTPGQQAIQQMSVPGLTLPQVIALVDKRLVALESGMKDLMESTPPQIQGDQDETAAVSQIPSNLTEVLDEFNLRFESLAEEIGNLKNIVLSLQTYTMDVNKMLLEERVKILSDGTSSNIV